MDIYKLNQAMSLNDARTVFYNSASNIDMFDAYNMPAVYRDLACYHAALADMTYERNMPDTSPGQLIMDAEYVAELGAWTCAEIVLNRALPVTMMHADSCQLEFMCHLHKGLYPKTAATAAALAAAGDDWTPLDWSKLLIALEEMDAMTMQEVIEYNRNARVITPLEDFDF